MENIRQIVEEADALKAGKLGSLAYGFRDKQLGKQPNFSGIPDIRKALTRAKKFGFSDRQISFLASQKPFEDGEWAHELCDED